MARVGPKGHKKCNGCVNWILVVGLLVLTINWILEVGLLGFNNKLDFRGRPTRF